MVKTSQDSQTTTNKVGVESADGSADILAESSAKFSMPEMGFIENPIENFAESSIESEEIELRSTPLPDAQIEASMDLIESLESIPATMAFKIGEAADIVGVKQYVLRYWETEFDSLRPKKSKNGQRVYTRRDVETAMMIKKLLYTDRFSIEGARSALRQLKSNVKEEKSTKAMIRTQESAASKLHGLVGEIRRIREIFA